MADEKEGKKSRAVVSLISVGVVLIIGLPVWWNTTKVYRATLPYAEIQELSNLQLNIEVNLTIIFEEEEPELKVFAEILSSKLNSNYTSAGEEKAPIHVSFNVKAKESNVEEKMLLTSLVNDVNLDAVDDGLQQLWKSDTNMLQYRFLVLSQQGDFSRLAHYAQCFVGKYKQTLMFHDKNHTHLAEVIAHVTKGVLIQENVMRDAFTQRIQTEKQEQESLEKIRDLKSVTGFHLSFSLINDEPETGILNWNIKETISGILQPLLNKISYFDITVDSQILHYSGVSLSPKTDGEVNYLTTEDLPHMINPIEGKLGSFVSLNPSLNFIVFVPPIKHTPLKIKDIDGMYSATNAFLSPRWGGVLIHNVYNRSEVNGSTPQIITLDTTSIMKVFLTQIRLLVGIKHVNSEKGVIISSVLNSGARDWEVYNLLLAKTMEYLSSSVKTLISLTQLMDKVKNMIIDDNIKTDIEFAVKAIIESQELLSQGSVVQAFFAAKMAIQLSEKAFYDPSVLELLYFPDDQKFAIYIPLFLPMSLPLIVSLYAAIKWLRNKDNGDIEDQTDTTQQSKTEDSVSDQKKDE